MKKRKKPDDGATSMGRLMAWPICPSCGLPARALFPSFDGKVCVQCHFAEVVRREARSLAEVIETLRDLGLCAYCGEYGAEVEHVIPRCSHLATYTIPACQECNGIAGGTIFDSLEDKRMFIRKGLRKKYAKVLRTSEWDDEETAEMGKDMREMIARWRAAREIMVQRLAWEPTLCARLEAQND